MGTGFSEPAPRWGHFTAAVEGEFYVWGGRTEDFHKKKSKLSLAASVHHFDPFQESWAEKCDSIDAPPLLYCGASASAMHHLYLYGGQTEDAEWQSSLHQLDTRSWVWKQLSSDGPMKKAGCGMINYGSRLVLFGGYGLPSSPSQPGFIPNSKSSHGSGWTNDLHVFDKRKGQQPLWYCSGVFK